METVSVYFKAPKQIAQLITETAEKQGYTSKSSFLTKLIMDGLIGYEVVRVCDVIADFCDCVEPRLRSLNAETKETDNMTALFRRLQTVYTKERLRPYMMVQRKLTDTAIESYLSENEDIVEQTGTEGFIIRSCIQQLWDKLYHSNLIDQDEWERHLQNYSLYLEHGEGKKLIQQE
jgi:hypothetical protein